MEHVFQLLLRYVHVVIDGKLIADAVQVFAQQAIVIERTDEVFHDFLLLVGKVLHVHLLLQLVVEGGSVAINHFLIVGVVLVVIPICVIVRHLVILSDAFQSLVEFIFSFFFLRLCLVGSIIVHLAVVITVFCIMLHRRVTIVAFVEHIVRVLAFQSRIIVQFGIDAILQFGEGHFQELHLQHLLGGESLKLLQLLCLCLNEFLSHIYLFEVFLLFGQVLFKVFLQFDSKLVQLVGIAVSISVPDILACFKYLAFRCFLPVEIWVAILVNGHDFRYQFG